jgi:phospholipase/lecithinase/hemolysin
MCEGWLGAQSSAAAATAFQARMAEVLGQAAAANLTDTASRTAASQQYMAKLADNLADRINDALIGNSARRIVVTNLPDITRTPRLRNALGALKLDPGPYADITAFGTSLATRFNQQLAARFANDSRVIVYDLYGSLNAWIGDPPPEFTQVQQPACPNTNPNLQALPTYSISTCTAAQLSSAATPADWWQRYLFADDFHPTPRGHEEAANQVIQLIRARGWR